MAPAVRGIRGAYALRSVRTVPSSALGERGIRTALAGSPFPGGKVFAEPQRGIALCGARESAAPAAGAKRKDNLRFSFLFGLLPFPWIVWRRLPTCDRCEIGERQSGYCSVTFSAFSQFTDSVLLHRWVHLSRRDITVSRNSLTRYTAWHLRIRRLVQFIFVGAVYHNALTTCATRLCRALRR